MNWALVLMTLGFIGMFFGTLIALAYVRVLQTRADTMNLVAQDTHLAEAVADSMRQEGARR